MITKVTHVTVWVKDQDEALKFYRDRLGFKVISDDSTTIPNYRWLSVAPQQQDGLEIVLNLATTPEQLAGVGKQGIFVFASSDIHADYAALKAKGVKLQTEPRVNPWGSDFIFETCTATISTWCSRPRRKRVWLTSATECCPARGRTAF